MTYISLRKSLEELSSTFQPANAEGTKVAILSRNTRGYCRQITALL